MRVETSRVRPRIGRITLAALAAAALSAALLGFPGHSRGSAAATQSSVNVVVIPAFAPPRYPGTNGVPALPTGAAQLSAYHFSHLSAGQVTAASLAPYDTAILYGIRWSDIPASAQAAINAFAATHKVLIWDSDDTGPQSYATFIHPFSVAASGENFSGKPNDSVVSFPGGNNFLASDSPSSPYYLDPQQLVTVGDEIKDMNAMPSGTKDWVPALLAANKFIPTIPNTWAWPLAWSYGSIGNQTGLTIYSGIDADAFANQKLNPNNAIKELALQLQASFRTAPNTSCAPGCNPPPQPPPPVSGSTHASCHFAKRLPRHWVHGRVVVWMTTSTASGVTARVVNRRGRIIGSGKEGKGDLIRLRLQTRRLRTNRISRLRALVAFDGQVACTKSFRLKVDNTRPRILFLGTRGNRVFLRASERSWVTFTGRHVRHRRAVLIAARKTVHLRLPARVRTARLVLRDRARNTVTRRLRW